MEHFSGEKKHNVQKPNHQGHQDHLEVDKTRVGIFQFHIDDPRPFLRVDQLGKTPLPQLGLICRL